MHLPTFKTNCSSFVYHCSCICVNAAVLSLDSTKSTHTTKAELWSKLCLPQASSVAGCGHSRAGACASVRTNKWNGRMIFFIKRPTRVQALIQGVACSWTYLKLSPTQEVSSSDLVRADASSNWPTDGCDVNTLPYVLCKLQSWPRVALVVIPPRTGVVFEESRGGDQVVISKCFKAIPTWGWRPSTWSRRRRPRMDTSRHPFLTDWTQPRRGHRVSGSVLRSWWD